jgi:hypothetical protein
MGAGFDDFLVLYIALAVGLGLLVVYDVVDDNICLDVADMVGMELANKQAVAVVVGYILFVVYSYSWPKAAPI